MRYSYNSTTHFHVRCTTDSRLELRIYQKKAQGNNTSKLRSTRPVPHYQRQETIKLWV